MEIAERLFDIALLTHPYPSLRQKNTVARRGFLRNKFVLPPCSNAFIGIGRELEGGFVQFNSLLITTQHICDVISKQKSNTHIKKLLFF